MPVSPPGARQEPARSPPGARQEPARSPPGARQEPARSPPGACQEPARSQTGKTAKTANNPPMKPTTPHGYGRFLAPHPPQHYKIINHFKRGVGLGRVYLHRLAALPTGPLCQW
ncbi:Protein PBMUCL2 [Venturia nashicola]|uniref:Protein PBMUCL2 n=1 Tax=Venturia nashicola TaxID=86259 RepID=A0A4Z1PIU0_9PEZI|nr:Protein PBMUCL2 [Venturia nashicola]TLD34850.1 Protein PBMUCL2 [Venturia nashicola]